LRLFNRQNSMPARIKTELLAGLTVALALVPEAVAFRLRRGRQSAWSGFMPPSSSA
jgi:MFS superfamily sulfate permease-like transporter